MKRTEDKARITMLFTKEFCKKISNTRCVDNKSERSFADSNLRNKNERKRVQFSGTTSFRLKQERKGEREKHLLQSLAYTMRSPSGTPWIVTCAGSEERKWDE